jgi:hypothetical protein
VLCPEFIEKHRTIDDERLADLQIADVRPAR